MLAAALPSDSMTVSAPAIPCPDLFRTYLDNPTLLNRIEYNLCLIEHHAGQYALGATHWVWEKLNWLWDEFWGLLSWSGRSIGKVTGWLWRKTKQVLQALRDELGIIADRLYDQFGRLGNWILVAGGLVVLVMVAPAINEGAKGLSYGAKALSHRARVRARKRRRK